jgi:hypothetical protein
LINDHLLLWNSTHARNIPGPSRKILLLILVFVIMLGITAFPVEMELGLAASF